jgi:hypothetical protein
MLQPALDEIDAMLAPYLKKELAEENAATRATAKQKADLARFKNAALSGNCLPSPHCPRRLRVFLAEESDHGAAHVVRLCKASQPYIWWWASMIPQPISLSVVS